MAYSGTNVTYGRGEGVVVATGMNTEVGNIAKMLNEADETDTPLKQNLNQLGKTLTYMILAICVVVFIIGVIRNPQHEPMNALLIDMFLTAVSGGCRYSGRSAGDRDDHFGLGYPDHG